MTTAEAFLAAHGYAAARRHPLPSDASARGYVRLSGGPRPALLMACPPPEDPRPFAALARHLRHHGLSAPAILAEDPAAGLLLVEDLGEHTLAARLDAGADSLPHYLAAAGALAALHAIPAPAGLPVWDAAAMARAAAATFFDWWWPAAFGQAPTAEVRSEFATAVGATLAPFATPAGIVHRDWFPANLVPLPDRAAPRDVGILDFQDAAVGHPAYDLVSLIEDARRDVAPAVRRAALARYFAGRPELDRTAFLGAMAACGAVRHLRVAALWVRLERRDGKPGYLVHGPRCWRLLDRSLSQPAAAPLRDFLRARVPAGMRCNPPPAPAPESA